jgi:hypothetical protein
MWDKQKSAMSKIPANKRQDDPKTQFVADLAEQIKKLENQGCEVIVGGDWNIPAFTKPGKDSAGTSKVAQLIKRGGVIEDVHSALNQSKLTKDISRHTYSHAGHQTCPDYILASSTLLHEESRVITQCATLLEYHTTKPSRTLNSMHCPTAITIDLARAFSVSRARLTSHRYDRQVPQLNFTKLPTIKPNNKKQCEKFTAEIQSIIPSLFYKNAMELEQRAIDLSKTTPHPAFAEHGDPDRPEILSELFTTEENHTLAKCWSQLEKAIHAATRRACPRPQKKRMMVRSWSDKFVKRQHARRVLHKLKKAYTQNNSPLAVRTLWLSAKL